MELESGERFKKAVIGGFDKADVMYYFEKMQKRHREETAALKAETAALRQSESGLRDKCGDQADTIAELNRELESLQASQKAAEEALAALRQKTEGELSSLRQKAEELQHELSSQKALNTELQMKKNVLEENLRAETAKNGALSSRVSELSERLSERNGIEIGDLLVEAKVSARRIVEQAKADAAALREDLRRQCGEAEAHLDGLGARLEEAEGHFRTLSEEALRAFDEVREELSGIRGGLIPREPGQEEADG